jgi:hypothetical protein
LQLENDGLHRAVALLFQIVEGDLHARVVKLGVEVQRCRKLRFGLRILVAALVGEPRVVALQSVICISLSDPLG